MSKNWKLTELLPEEVMSLGDMLVKKEASSSKEVMIFLVVDLSKTK